MSKEMFKYALRFSESKTNGNKNMLTCTYITICIAELVQHGLHLFSFQVTCSYPCSLFGILEKKKE